jgi:hypothetical protein
MLRRRRTGQLTPELGLALEAFDLTIQAVDDAKATLLLGIPFGRSSRLPLAEAVLGFERGIADARSRMAGWRISEVEPEWRACSVSLDRAAAGAERLRLGESTEAYEELVPVLDALLDPLGAFDAAAARIRALGG